MSEYLFKWPGQQSPPSPNADDRILAESCGLVEFMVLADQDASQPTPEFFVSLGHEMGDFVDPLVVMNTGKFIFRENGLDGKVNFVFRLKPDEIKLKPDTYTIRVFAGDRLLVNRSLVVPATLVS